MSEARFLRSVPLQAAEMAVDRDAAPTPPLAPLRPGRRSIFPGSGPIKSCAYSVEILFLNWGPFTVSISELMQGINVDDGTQARRVFQQNTPITDLRKRRADHCFEPKPTTSKTAAFCGCSIQQRSRTASSRPLAMLSRLMCSSGSGHWCLAHLVFVRLGQNASNAGLSCCLFPPEMHVSEYQCSPRAIAFCRPHRKLRLAWNCLSAFQHKESGCPAGQASVR